LTREDAWAKRSMSANIDTPEEDNKGHTSDYKEKRGAALKAWWAQEGFSRSEPAVCSDAMARRIGHRDDSEASVCHALLLLVCARVIARFGSSHANPRR
jgi:hypothetical protein